METNRVKYQDLLIHEFEARAKNNPSYSLRAFARDLQVSVSSLSRILAGKRDLSLKYAPNVAKVLGLSPSETEYFYALIQSRHARSEKIRAMATEKLSSQEMAGAELSLDYFKTIADWHYFAILELTQVDGFKNNSKWIASRLGIGTEVVDESIQRLKKLELIEEDAKGNWTKTYDFKATPSGIPNRALKLHHQQILKKAETALFEREITEGDFSSTSFSMAGEDLVWAKEELKKFRRQLTQRLSKKPKKDRLYELSIQLFPLDQINLKPNEPKKGQS